MVKSSSGRAKSPQRATKPADGGPTTRRSSRLLSKSPVGSPTLRPSKRNLENPNDRSDSTFPAKGRSDKQRRGTSKSPVIRAKQQDVTPETISLDVSLRIVPADPSEGDMDPGKRYLDVLRDNLETTALTSTYKAENNGVGDKKIEKNSQTADIPVNCPYLGTINRHLLDFDFEKICSISLSNKHVYACLICGKYFQGRGKNTHCYTHALEEGHYLFMNLEDCTVYCLPENYRVDDASLNDIKDFLKPKFTKSDVEKISKEVLYGKALDGTDFIPGCIGLNNLKNTDFFNVIIQMFCCIVPLRNKLLLMDVERVQPPDAVLSTLVELVRKNFNPHNFKGIVSPHEFLQAVGVSSSGLYKIGIQGDPVALLSWLLNRLHVRLHKKHTKGTLNVMSFG
ncbi:ubiquitin carboxyl-terminal hydrolase, putative [Theileria equi strain WA]|uniref:Ubiquitin carboxyl-terminal hydrolase, putative n=1 Tax=Theileria equi strain WA TaxID=1537102 RepID=L0AYL2_THEEQ|nr:ubiquitin carboxyl-terminal hydrolase, putative [Theileria equi strain WA]AFZ80655.1 ubiquitin carboxyl-terminal hydrolase, putative [Theileria equi strain WA]|eukprot:XP_004830321.1 ubiquitin carboxyl-terminal hydrolase, putative [Theileria equi strain WA]